MPVLFLLIRERFEGLLHGKGRERSDDNAQGSSKLGWGGMGWDTRRIPLTASSTMSLGGEKQKQFNPTFGSDLGVLCMDEVCGTGPLHTHTRYQ